jgi:hypothetical protein
VRYSRPEAESGVLVVLELTRKIAQQIIRPDTNRLQIAAEQRNMTLQQSRLHVRRYMLRLAAGDTMKRLSLAGGGIRVSSIIGSLVLVKVAVSDTGTQRCSSHRRLRQL